MRVCVYTRSAPGEEPAVIERQIEAVRSRLALVATAGHAEAYYSDEHNDGRTPIDRRPRGCAMCATLLAGDVVIMAEALRGWVNPAEMARQVCAWADARVRTIILDLGLDTATPGQLDWLGAWNYYQEACLLESKAHHRRQIMKGKSAASAATRLGTPPYGFGWFGKPGKKNLKEDSVLRKQGGDILALVEAGVPYEKVAERMKGRKMRGGTRGVKWSPKVVKRMYEGEKAWRLMVASGVKPTPQLMEGVK